MILHFVVDDKFIDSAAREFELVAPGQHRFILISKKRQANFIKQTPVEFASAANVRDLLSRGEYRAVCLHSLYSGHSVIPRIPDDKKILWIGWGYDYYKGPLLASAFPSGLLLPETEQLVRTKVPKPSLTSRAKGVASRILRPSDKVTPEILSRIDYFSPVLDVEYHLVRQWNPWFRAQYLPWNYGTAEDDILASECLMKSTGSAMLVGNSATPENNHLDVFRILGGHPEALNREVIVPLSYGDPASYYTSLICKAGQRAFGDRFTPLLRFLPREEYAALLARCGFVFMNHVRQQGTGNAIMMLVAGAKVYLNSQSPFFGWLKRKRVVVFDIAEIQDTESPKSKAFEPLSRQEKENNFSFVMDEWNRDVQRRRTKAIVETLLN